MICSITAHSNNLLPLRSCTSSSPQSQSSSFHPLPHPYSALSGHRQPLVPPAPFSHLAAPKTGRCPVPKLDKDLKFDEEMPAPWWQWDYYIESLQCCYPLGDISKNHLYLLTFVFICICSSVCLLDSRMLHRFPWNFVEGSCINKEETWRKIGERISK